MEEQLNEIQLKLELLKLAGKRVTIQLKGRIEISFVLDAVCIEINKNLILLHNLKSEYIITLHLGEVVSISRCDKVMKLHFDSRI